MQDGEFYARLTELGRLKGKHLSNRALAGKTGMSPTTIGRWLRGERFPADIGKLVTVVREIARVAQVRQVPAPDGLFDPDQWRTAYFAEASRRAVLSTFSGPRLRQLAQEAEGRGLLRHAARLRKRAAMRGDAMAAAELIMELRGVFPGVKNPPWPIAQHVALHDPWGVANLMDELRRIGAEAQLAALIGRGPGEQAACENLEGAIALLGELRRSGAAEQTAALAGRLAAGAVLDDPAQVIRLISGLRGAGAYAQIAGLLARDPAARVALEDPESVVALVLELRGAGAGEQALALANRAAARFADGDPESAARAAGALRVNLEDHAEAFAFRFLYGAYEPAVAASLITMLANSGETEKLRRFLASDPAGEVPLEDASGVAELLGALQLAGSFEQLRVLLARDPVARIKPEDVSGAVRMLEALRGLGIREQGPLSVDDLAGRVTADDPWSLALVLKMLAEDGAGEAMAALLTRCPAASVGMRDPQAVAGLLGLLRAIGAHDQAAALVDRLPAEGHFALFLDQADNRTRFRFGRAPDGTPAAPWDWKDLD